MLGLGLGLVYETNLMGGSGAPSFIDTFGQPAIGLSLRDLLGTDPIVLRARRDSDDAEADFKASEVSDGTLLNWVNEAQTLFDENFASSTGWTLRSGATISGGSLNLLNVTNSAETAYKSFGSIPFQKVLITITVTDYVQGAIDVRNLGGGGNTSPNITANGTYTYEITLGDGNTNWGIGTSAGPTTLKVSNLKVEVLTANGLVRTWYGQGNGVNAEQTSASSQPFIVTNGVLETENGEPAIRFDGVNKFLINTEFSLDLSLGISVFNVVKANAINIEQFIWASVLVTNNRCNLSTTLSGQTGFGHRTGSIVSKSFNSTLNQTLITQTSNGIIPNIFENTILGLNNTAAFNALAQPNIFAIGNNSINSVSLPFNGKIQSVIAYNVDKTIEQSAIEANINNYYTIY